MKIAVLADIHANLEALEAVLIAAANAGAERIICLGDIVGYGPDPLGCIYRLKEVDAQIVLGNHDQAVLEPVRIQSFNLLARPSLYQACEVLGRKNEDFLQQGVFRRVEARCGSVPCQPPQARRMGTPPHVRSRRLVHEPPQVAIGFCRPYTRSAHLLQDAR